MLQNKQNILLAVLIILVGYNIFSTSSIATDINSYKVTIDSLQTKVDSAQSNK